MVYLNESRREPYISGVEQLEEKLKVPVEKRDGNWLKMVKGYTRKIHLSSRPDLSVDYSRETVIPLLRKAEKAVKEMKITAPCFECVENGDCFECTYENDYTKNRDYIAASIRVRIRSIKSYIEGGTPGKIRNSYRYFPPKIIGSDERVSDRRIARTVMRKFKKGEKEHPSACQKAFAELRRQGFID